MIVLYVGAGAHLHRAERRAAAASSALILTEAFTPTAAIGGFAGASRGAGDRGRRQPRRPVERGRPRQRADRARHRQREAPGRAGLVGVFEVFIDTIVVCSMTAFVILESGLWTDPAYQNASGDLTAAAMGTTIPFASAIVALCSFLFGFSTLIGWCYYGEKCFEFLFGSR
jgi:alanine or glycine:cation symporter, AGCS family